MSCRPNDPGATHHDACTCRQAAYHRVLEDARQRANRLEASNDTLSASVRLHRAMLEELVDAAGGGRSCRRATPGELGDALDRARKVLGR